MKIVIFGKQFDPGQIPYVQQLFDELYRRGAKICVYKNFFDKIKDHIRFAEKPGVFVRSKDIEKLDFLFSIGGDGTLLDAIPYVHDLGVPILGINLGRLGFLSSVSKQEMVQAIDHIYSGNYSLDQRTLLQLEKPSGLFGRLNFALNDLTIYRNNNTSLVSVHVYVNDLFLNTYWGDGLIIATPTGSTAYSMSVGGPILTPGSENFVIAPIASHNLTVRPIVIQDNSEIRIKIEGREEKYLLSLDSRQQQIDKTEEMIIKKCDFRINLVQMPGQNFFSTIREKLLWGVDSRN
ncbi:NAD kinase [Candidatus Sulfidibacterium hydrothermale]|uniref:NAD kinase n=1 Tax=Candidatus Sulfidibacterium hydrothermale TaxID=2875962 RepID=UPI001F0B61EB|nr:NAD kinase [Candidatus Sulfidibacterium hydrothermale]UBM62066.1 NAD kinase [Candidatus Sulfidibacterium hydrothermale]